MIKPLLLGLVTAIIFSLPATAQNQKDGRIHVPEVVQQGQDTQPIPIRSGNPVDEEAFARMRVMRMEQMKHDTDKLYQLTGELKAYIDKNGQDTLSLDMVKKADEIEKLAHGVKQKMKENQ